MKTKQEKQKEALARLYRRIDALRRDDWDPSSKDLCHGRILEEKIQTCEREIENLERILQVPRASLLTTTALWAKKETQS